MKQGWEIKKLGDLCSLMTGGTPSRGRKEYFEGGSIKWLVSGDIHKNEIFDCEGRITELGMANSNAKLLPINSVMIALNGQGKTRGTVSLLRTYATCNQSLVSIFPKDLKKILPEYIFCNLHSRYEEIRRITGDDDKDRRGLNMPLIRNIPIPLPPLPEQRRIVAILDEAFAGINRAKEIAEQNLRNAREIFESYLQGVFENGDWETKSIEEVCEEIYAGGDAPKNNFSLEPNEKHQIPIFANAVKERGLYGFTDFARVNKPCVTIAARGSGTGHTELRNEPFLPIVRLIVCIPDTKLMSTEFLKYTIDNLVIQRSGSAIPQLTVPMIMEYEIPVPTIEKQIRLIEKAETLRAETQKLEYIYNQKLKDLEELKKRVLQKAFNGELN